VSEIGFFFFGVLSIRSQLITSSNALTHSLTPTLFYKANESTILVTLQEYGSTIYCLSQSNGEVEWSYTAESQAITFLTDSSEHTVYVSNLNDILLLDSEDGSLQNKFTIDTSDSFPRVVLLTMNNSTLFVSDANGGVLYAVDKKKGNTLWTFSSSVGPSALLSDGSLVFSSGGGLTVIDSVTGVPRWSGGPSPDQMFVDGNDYIYVMQGKGFYSYSWRMLYVLDPASGSVLYENVLRPEASRCNIAVVSNGFYDLCKNDLQAWMLGFVGQ